MKTISLLLIISSFMIGVFGDDVTSVSLMERDSVTLHTDLIDIQMNDVIEWRFGDKKDLIAIVNRAVNKTESFDGPDGRFRDRLQVDHQTGSLTITNISTQHTGLYQVDIIRERITTKTFNLSVFSGDVKSVSVMEGDSVTLHTDPTDIQNHDVIRWRFQHGDSPLAELNRRTRIIFIYHDVHDGIFRDRLKLDNQTGSLTIKNIRMKHSGLYDVNITSSRTHTIYKSFNITVIDGVKSESVMEGESVTLHTDLTDIHTHDRIHWMFVADDSLIAQLYKPNNIFTTYKGTDERFRDRLNLNDQTGSLTIINTRTEDSGLYELKISSRRRSVQRNFILIVSAQGLSSGAIAGICVGVLLGIAVAAVVGVYCCHLRFPKARAQEVMEGDAVILHTDVTVRPVDVEMEWKFQNTLIAEIRSSNSTTDDEVLDGKFRDRLKLNDQTGFLTITDTRTTDAGVYHLKISSSRAAPSYKRFRLTVTGTHKQILVNEGESYTLQTDVTEVEGDDVMKWMFGEEETLIAEINPANNICSTHDDADDGLFRDVLKLNHQTGDLTINNIRQNHTGLYTLKIIRRDKTSYKRFSVSLRDSNRVSDSEPLMNGNGPQR